jgi:DNA-binding transcriptional LysR family regulator
MDLLQLKYFQTVARLEHMTQAAKELSIAQPSLSQTIARLENELGMPLFERQGRHIQLNVFGRAFLRHVERLFGELDEARQELADLAGAEQGQIALSVIVPQILPELLGAFQERHPHISFRLFHQRTLQAVQQQVERGEVDLCITTSPLEPEGIGWQEEISRVPLLSDEIYLLFPLSHPLARRESIHLSEVAHEPFISLKPGDPWQDLTDHFCRQAGFTPRVVFEGDELETIRSLVMAGLGVSFISHLMVHSAPYLATQPVRILPVSEPRCRRQLELVWRTTHYLSQAAQQFRSFVIQYFHQLEQERP